MIAEVTELALPDTRGAAGDSSAVACLLSVCGYFGCEPHGGGAFEQLLESARSGDTAPEDIVAAAQDLGVHASAGPLALDQLTAKIEAGLPVLADLGEGRYVVVFGLVTAGLLVMDPQTGHQVLPLDDWPGAGIVLEMPGAEYQTQEITPPLGHHEALAHHYAGVWNVLHDQGEQVPHWELNGAHENLSGTDWHVDLGHDGAWRPLHTEDMERVYLWPRVEKGYGAGIEKAKRRRPDPQQGLFGQWTEADKPAPRRTPQSSTAFEGMQPRRGHGSGGGQFSKINTGKAPGQLDLFGPSSYAGRAAPEAEAEPSAPEHKPQQGGLLGQGGFAERAEQQAPAATAPTGTHEGTQHAPKGGVTLAGEFFVGGRFIPKLDEKLAESTPAEKQEFIAKEEQSVKTAEQQAHGQPAAPTIPAEHPASEPTRREAATRVRQTRQRKLTEAREQAHGELLGAEGGGGDRGGLFSGQQLGAEPAPPLGGDQAGVVPGVASEGRSGELPDNAGGQRGGPGGETAEGRHEPVPGAGGVPEAAERPAEDEGGRGGGEAATGSLGTSGGAGGVEAAPPTPAEEVLSQPPTPETPTDLSAGNFHYDTRDFFAGGPKAKFRNNIEAIRALREIKAEGRTAATPEEQAVLSKYVGWGQLPQVFDHGNWDWHKEREELQGLLSETDWEAARRSTLNAHYTYPEVVDAHWKMADKLGFKGGKFLETSAGIGYYLGLMPGELSAKTRSSAVELDPTSGGILKLLYPGSNVHVQGFQDFAMPDNFYDLIASNVPFGDYKVHDPRYNKHHPHIHDYFFLKSLDLARPGALVMHITSSGTMDKGDDEIRKLMADKAELVAAVRFPGGAHKENAGTEVVTDLLILRKKDPSVPPAADETPGEAEPKQPGFTGTTIDSLGRLYHWVDGKRVPAPDWTSTTTVPDPAGGEPIPVNKYFADHPEQILGTLDRTGTMYHGESVNVSPTGDYEQRLQAAIDRLPENALRYAPAPTERFTPNVMPAPGDVREGGFVVQDGKVYQKELGQLVEQKVSPKDLPRIEGQLAIRDAVWALLNAQLRGEATDDLRADLNRVYDAYVKKNGALNDRGNYRAFQKDPDSPVLLALENVNPETGAVTKADIFAKDTVRPNVPVERADSASEALGISLNQRGGVDLDHMAELTGDGRAAIERELIEKGLAFHDPQEGWKPADQYLSGNVRRKLLMAKAAAAADPMYAANVQALEKVQPEDIDYQDIDAKLGAPWIPPDDIKGFAASLLDARPEDFDIAYVPHTGLWMADLSRHGDYLWNRKAMREIWGTPRKDFMTLLEAGLLGRTVAVYDEDAEGNKIINRQATDDANAKIQEIKDRFKEWVWEDEERRDRLHRYYNDNYNNIRNIQYNGEHLTFPGMNPDFKMRDVQKNFVWQAIATGKGLTAAEVGIGKTAQLIAAAMELRRLGLAKKPALAVKKANIEEHTAFARWLYPGARILSTADVNNAAQRKEMISKIATGDYDLVIMTHDHLNLMDMLPETQASYIRDELADLRAAKANALVDSQNKKSPTVKELEKAEARLEARLKEAMDSKKKDNALYFEESGIDHLLVDEAHAYKSLKPYTRMEQVKGIPNQQSDRATNMLMRTRWLMDNNNGRGVVFATGTPVGNTMVELYTMQRYLQPKELEERGISNFDAWAQTFGDLVTKREFTPRGTYEPVTRFGSFVNIPELMQLSRQFMDVQRVDDLKNPDGTPAIARPKRNIDAVVAPRSEGLAAYMENLKRRAEMIRGKRVEKGGDNMLVICTDGKKAAVDMRLVDPNAEDDPGSKTNLCVGKVLDLARERPGVTQLIFTNTRQSKANPGFNLYNDIIGKLVAGGIPREKIADFSQLEGEKRDQVQEAMRRGEILVGIGGTDTLGTGVNVQNRLAALHHLDVPDRPSDIEQRDGRGYRYGNQNDPTRPLEDQKIDIYRYVTEGSADQTFWQRIANKAHFISQALKSSGKELARTIADEDTESMSPERFIAIASGDPRVTEKMDLEDEVKRLRNAKDRHEREQFRFQQSVKGGEAQTPHLEKRIEHLKADEKTLADNPDFSLTIDGKTYTDRKEASEAFKKKADAIGGTYSPQKIGQYRGLELYRHGSKFYLEGQGGTQYETGPSVPSVEAVARRQPNRIREGEESLQAHRQDIEKTRGQLGKQWQKHEELATKEKRLADLEAELGGKDKEKEAVAPAAPVTPAPAAPAREEPPPQPTRITDTGWAAPATPAASPAREGNLVTDFGYGSSHGLDPTAAYLYQHLTDKPQDSSQLGEKANIEQPWKFNTARSIQENLERLEGRGLVINDGNGNYRLNPDKKVDFQGKTVPFPDSPYVQPADESKIPGGKLLTQLADESKTPQAETRSPAAPETPKPAAIFGIGQQVSYTGNRPFPGKQATFRGYSIDPNTGERLARVTFTHSNGAPLDTVVPASDLAISEPYAEASRRAAELTKPKEPAPPPSTFTPSAHLDTLSRAVQTHGGRYNHASLKDVRQQLAASGVTERAQQDAVIQEGRKQGLVSASALEGRNKPSPEEMAATIDEEGSKLGHLSLREQSPSSALTLPSAPGGEDAGVKAVASAYESAATSSQEDFDKGLEALDRMSKPELVQTAAAVEHRVVPSRSAAALREELKDRLSQRRNMAARVRASGKPKSMESEREQQTAPSSSPSPSPSVSIKRVKTKRGERSVHSFAPNESFWQARKAGKVPGNVTLYKHPGGRWEASIWGENDKEIHETLEKLRAKGVRV